MGRALILQCPSCVLDAMFYSKVLLLLAVTTDVFGLSVGKSPQVGIVGGDPLRISEVPFMVELRQKTSGFHMCGGSIVNEKFILTSAHCCSLDIEVAVGTNSIHEGEVYAVDKIIPHQGFMPNSYEHDICLVKLANNLNIGPTVKRVELATKRYRLQSGMSFDVIGWGRTEPKGNVSDLLRVVSVPFVDQRECERLYGKKVSDNVFCAGTKGKGVCHGDSGGPLLRNNLQVGITLMGVDCYEYPALYTKIAAYEQWIKHHLTEEM